MKDICKILMQGPCPRTVTTGCFEPAVKIPMGNSHGQFDVYAKICGKNGSPRLRPAFCANPRSRNAFGHVTSDVTREFGSKVAQTKTTAYTSCKPAPSNAHGYLTQAISRESKEKNGKLIHQPLTILSVDTLSGKKNSFGNFSCELISLEPFLRGTISLLDNRKNVSPNCLVLGKSKGALSLLEDARSYDHSVE